MRNDPPLDPESTPTLGPDDEGHTKRAGEGAPAPAAAETDMDDGATIHTVKGAAAPRVPPTLDGPARGGSRAPAVPSSQGLRMTPGAPLSAAAAAQPERYENQGEIARGGMGAILKLVDTDIRRPVAMKVMLGGASEDQVRRFVAEGQVTGQLEHPNIVPIHEIGTLEETARGPVSRRPYFTMKLVKGRSLEAILRDLAAGDPTTVRTFPLSQLLHVFLKACDAMAFAHSRGVIHRDLKPENIMVGEFGEVLLMDWGLAKVLDAAGEEDKAPRAAERKRSGRTAAADPEESVSTVRSDDALGRSVTGDVMGTPAYMAPEQADGQVDKVDERSDVFALGAVLYRILTLQPPYTGTTLTNIVVKAVNADVVPPRQRSPEACVPPELESVVMKAMAPKKAARYASVIEFADDVRAFLDHRLVSAHRYGTGARILRFLQRHPAGSLAAGVAVLFLALGSGAVGVFAARAQTHAAQAAESEARAAAEAARAKEQEAQAQAEAARAEAQAARAEKAEALKAKAEERAVQAEEALLKGRRVSSVLRSAHIELGPVADRLKRSFTAGWSLEKKQEFGDDAWGRVEEYERLVPDDGASLAGWLAVKGWLRRLAGFEDEAAAFYRASREADADVAFAPLFEAMAQFSVYVQNQPYPAFQIRDGRFSFRWIPGENAVMKAARERFEALMEEARRAPIWGETSATDFQEALLGFKAMHANDLDAAEAGMTKALALPEMAWIREELFQARGKVRLLKMDFTGALEDLERVLAVNSLDPEAAKFHAQSWQCKAYWEAGKGRDPRPSMRRAVTEYERLAEMYPQWQSPWHALGMAYQTLGNEEQARGGDPEESWTKSIAAFTEATRHRTQVAMDHNLAVSFHGRGCVHLCRAQRIAAAGEDAAPEYLLAIGDFHASLHHKIWHPAPRESLPSLYLQYGRYLAGIGRAPRAAYEDLLARFRAGEGLEPVWRWKGHLDEALLLEFLQRHAEAGDAFARTRDGYDRARLETREGFLTPSSVKHLGQWRDAARAESQKPSWTHALLRGDLFLQAGDLAACCEEYEQALDGATAAGAAKDGRLRARLAGAHYALAGLYASRSTGRELDGAKPASLPEEQAARFRDKGLAHLGSALALGFADSARLSRDPDLDPLRKHPRWAETLKNPGNR